jgi:hypothetical protein
VAENRRGGCLGDGDKCAGLGCGRTRRTSRGVRKKFRPAGGGSILTGSGGRGRRGGRRVEAEREREGGLAWRGAAWHWHGNGPAAARVGGVLPRDRGERRGRRDVGRRG